MDHSGVWLWKRILFTRIPRVFHLDYFSCALTVLSTVLVARKMWTGLVVAGINSGLICLIGLRTSQLGFIPANLFCIAVYVVSLRSWLRPRAR
jgi:hypothetical protein